MALRSLSVNGLLPTVPLWIVGQGLGTDKLLVACKDHATPTAPVTVNEMLPLARRLTLPGGKPGDVPDDGFVIVSDWVAEVNRPLAAVMVGLPAALSL